MKQKIAKAALKYAAKEGGKNARKKVADGLEKVARAVRPNPAKAPRTYSHELTRADVRRLHPDAVKLQEGVDGSWIVFFSRDSFRQWEKEMDAWRKSRVRPNPYDHAGATFDLFGGESRRLPKKVSEYHRPRVRVRGGTMTLADGSPFKGRVVKLNPAPRVVVHPLRVTLTAAEVKEHKRNPAAFVAALLAKAATVSTEWDHIEARGPGGRHLFDVIP